VGWDAEVVDFVPSWSWEQLTELFKSRINKNSKFVGLSFVFSYSSYDPLVEIITKYLKENYPQLLIISGSQGLTQDSDYVDYHVCGYGEFAIEAIVKYHFANGEKPIISPKYFGRKTKVIDALHSYTAAPNTNPMIDYEKRDFIHHNEFGRIEFARGCKFSCIYCNYPILGVKGDSTRNADGARLQLQRNFDKWGMTNYDVADETFNDTTEKIIKFADVVETLSFRPWFKGHIRADLLVSRPNDKEELLRMGFLGHFYGVETFNSRSAKAIKKGMNPQKLQDGLLYLKKYFSENTGNKFRLELGLIAGLPYETKESLEETKYWVKTHWMDQCISAYPLQIIPENSYRTSEMTTTYAGYGYTIIGHNTLENYLLWKNENMEFDDACRWSEAMENIYRIGSQNLKRLDLVGLEDLLGNDDELIPLDIRLKLMQTMSEKYRKNNFVESYINKKLSM
jgi:radical SAM superfamily enzyme YgiQ (UPF0313 family)